MSFQLDRSSGHAPAPVRYAVRQVLDQELRKEKLLANALARQARSSTRANNDQTVEDEDKENQTLGEKVKNSVMRASAVKRDFFGRIVNEVRPVRKETEDGLEKLMNSKDDGRTWVSFHEGFSNAVRKPITLRELLETF